MKIFPIILFGFLLQQLHAQSGFQQLYGGPDHERAQNIFPFSGGYVINGTTKSFGAGYYDACLLKVNSAGIINWSNTYGNAGFDNSECAIETYDHKLICAGRTEIIPGGQTTAIIFKVDSSGNTEWSHSYGINSNSSFAQIIETKDHGYAAVGYIQNSGSKDVYFVRTNDSGDTLFSKSFSSSLEESGMSVLQMPDSSFYISGRIVNAGTANAMLIHTDKSGNILWVKKYGMIMWDEFNCLKAVSDSTIIIAGATTSSGVGTYDILLAESDLQGNILWCNTYGGMHTDAAYDVRVTNSGLITGGYTETFTPSFRGDDSTNIYLMKTDFNGNFLWMEIYGDGLQDEGFHCELDNDGGYLVPAFTTSYLQNDSSQMLIIKTDSNGLSGCHEKPAIPAQNIYAINSTADTLVTLNINSFDTLLLQQNSAAFTFDDACMIAKVENIRLDFFNIYPVPAKEFVSIESEKEFSTVRIVSVTGSVIDSQKNYSKKININVSGIANGVYTAEIISGGNIMRKRFCVLH